MKAIFKNNKRDKTIMKDLFNQKNKILNNKIEKYKNLKLKK